MVTQTSTIGTPIRLQELEAKFLEDMTEAFARLARQRPGEQKASILSIVKEAQEKAKVAFDSEVEAAAKVKVEANKAAEAEKLRLAGVIKLYDGFRVLASGVFLEAWTEKLAAAFDTLPEVASMTYQRMRKTEAGKADTWDITLVVKPITKLGKGVRVGGNSNGGGRTGKPLVVTPKGQTEAVTYTSASAAIKALLPAANSNQGRVAVIKALTNAGHTVQS